MKHPLNPMITLRSLSKSYIWGDRRIKALQDISLSIQPGEMVAILGASGSGKSTLMNILGLLDQAYEGEYWLHQEKMILMPDAKLALLRNRKIGFVFQQFHLLPRLTALQNVALPLLYRHHTKDYSEAQAMQILAYIHMDAYATRYPHELSGGQQQRVAIARALIGHPDVILADEPTGALDAQTRDDIMHLFHRLHDQGRTLLIITHESMIAQQCARKIQLADGRLISDQTT